MKLHVYIKAVSPNIPVSWPDTYREKKSGISSVSNSLNQPNFLAHANNS